MKSVRQWWTHSEAGHIKREHGRQVTLISAFIKYNEDTSCQDAAINQLQNGVCCFPLWPCDAWSWTDETDQNTIQSGLMLEKLIVLSLQDTSCETQLFRPRLATFAQPKYTFVSNRWNQCFIWLLVNITLWLQQHGLQHWQQIGVDCGSLISSCRRLKCLSAIAMNTL